MSQIWFTADLHLDHLNTINFDKRPFASIEEMNDAIVQRWNTKVDRKDEVYIIGDFAWKNHGHWIQALTGKKHLLVGSHDKMAQNYLRNFNSVSPLKQITIDRQPIVMCHWALRTWQGKGYGTLDLYGHSHGRLNEHIDSYHSDVGCMVWDYTPVSFEELKLKFASRKEAWQHTHSGGRDEPEELASMDLQVETLATENRRFRI